MSIMGAIWKSSAGVWRRRIRIAERIVAESARPRQARDEIQVLSHEIAEKAEKTCIACLCSLCDLL
jgi:ribosomal protein S7